jgi:hypothetical protein
MMRHWISFIFHRATEDARGDTSALQVKTWFSMLHHVRPLASHKFSLKHMTVLMVLQRITVRLQPASVPPQPASVPPQPASVPLQPPSVPLQATSNPH